MSTYTTNTKPESKFEDVPEEVLTDPTMRTALGMDPIPGMNTPVDDNKQISMFDYMQNKNNSSASSSTTTTAAPEVTVFKNLVHPEFGELRTVEIDGEPWFVGKDVAVALGYKKPENAIANHVSDEDKTSTLIQGSGSNYKSKATIINESGLYSLILSSKLPSAKEFKHWVTSEVLPSIRKNGAYIRNQENIMPVLFCFSRQNLRQLCQRLRRINCAGRIVRCIHQHCRNPRSQHFFKRFEIDLEALRVRRNNL